MTYEMQPKDVFSKTTPSGSHHYHYRVVIGHKKAVEKYEDVCKDVNVEFGAPAEKQIITGAPSLDRLNDVVERDVFCAQHGINSFQKILLMLGTHRNEVKIPADNVFREIIDTYAEDDSYQLIYKPHPVEIAKGTSLDISQQVMLMTSQVEYLALVKSADVIISPATSVIVPAMAFSKPFINTISMDCKGASEESLERQKRRTQTTHSQGPSRKSATSAGSADE